MKHVKMVFVMFAIALIGVMARPTCAQTFSGSCGLSYGGPSQDIAIANFVGQVTWFGNNTDTFTSTVEVTFQTIDEYGVPYGGGSRVLQCSADLTSDQTYGYYKKVENPASTTYGYITYDNNGAYVKSEYLSGGYPTWGSWLTANGAGTGYWHYQLVYIINIHVNVTDNDTSESHNWYYTYYPNYGW